MQQETKHQTPDKRPWKDAKGRTYTWHPYADLMVIWNPKLEAAAKKMQEAPNRAEQDKKRIESGEFMKTIQAAHKEVFGNDQFAWCDADKETIPDARELFWQLPHTWTQKLEGKTPRKLIDELCLTLAATMK